MPVRAQPAHHDPARVPAAPTPADRPRPRPAEVPRRTIRARPAHCLDQRPRPQRPLDILDQLAVQLLPPEPRAAVHAGHRRPEILGRCADCRRPPAGLHASPPAPRSASAAAIGRGVVVTTARGRSPSRSPSIRLSQVVVRLRPFGELVAPGEMMLGPRSASGLLARIGEGPRPVGKTQHPPARHPAQRPRRSAPTASSPLSPSTITFADLVHRRADQRDPRAPDVRAPAPHPFRPGPRLAEAAPGHHQPHPPVAGRLALPAMRPSSANALRSSSARRG